MKGFLRLIVFLFGISSTLAALAAGVIEAASGQVRVGISAASASAATVKQRISAGTTLTTGPKSSAVVRFDDGQAIVLHENSEFRVAEYSFVKDQPGKDRFGFELIKGALRSVTASLTRRNSKAYSLRTATGTIGIRGTDFVVAVVNPVFLRVLNGTIEVANTAGAATFATGAVATATDAGTLAVTIPLSALPPVVAATFSALAGLAIVVDGAAGASVATSAAEGTLTLPAALGIAGAIAVGAAAASNHGGSGPTATGTTGTR